jgi:hypothetical protein
LLLFAICPIAKDLFYFPFQFTFYEVQWRFQEIWSMSLCFIVWGQERCMKHVVDFPSVREFQAVGDVGYLSDYLERSISHQFHGFIGEL